MAVIDLLREVITRNRVDLRIDNHGDDRLIRHLAEFVKAEEEDAVEEQRRRIREKYRLQREEEEIGVLLLPEEEETDDSEEEGEELTVVNMLKPAFVNLERFEAKQGAPKDVVVLEKIQEKMEDFQENTNDDDDDDADDDLDTDDDANEAEEDEAWKGREIERIIKRRRDDIYFREE